MHGLKIAISTVLIAVAGYGFAAAAEAIPADVMVRNGVFTDAKGMNLYISDEDRRPNVSACYTNCGNNWPAFNPSPGAHDTGDWKIITRDDGTTQWAYKNKPVYYFLLDRMPGDDKGDGIGNVWHTARQ